MQLIEQVRKLAYEGNWSALLPILKQHPHLINTSTSPKNYTPLCQVAWHGATLDVAGQFLMLGADRTHKTYKNQTAFEIAKLRYPERLDLQYVLSPEVRTMAQMMRKVVADYSLFEPYDGNQIVFDQMIASFGIELCSSSTKTVEERMAAMFKAITGVSMTSRTGSRIFLEQGLTDSDGCNSFAFNCDLEFWRNHFLPALQELTSRIHLIPIEKTWAVVSDLFFPAPNSWGLRGSLFLWLEMRQVLCHVEIPNSTEALSECISSTFVALTGKDIKNQEEYCLVKRFSRGGMSSGAVSYKFWREEIIPLLQKRLKWLQEMWG